LVTAVGCLAPAPTGAWKLVKGSKAVSTRVQGTSATELAGNAHIRLGAERYQLLGADVFDPGRFGKSRVVVKGVLIPAPDGSRINVTSMQASGANCPP
jgi:hypothetical protein